MKAELSRARYVACYFAFASEPSRTIYENIRRNIRALIAIISIETSGSHRDSINILSIEYFIFNL